MRVAIMGTGGVGGYYGALLALKKHDVSFIARGPHLRAIQKNGLQIRSAPGDILIEPARATDKPANVGTVDLVLFCTKTYDIAPAAVEAKALIGPATTVVSLQNGIDAHERIGEVVGMEHVLPGVTGIISMVEALGIIRVESIDPWMVVGELSGSITPRVQAVCEAFKGTRVEIEASEHILVELWTKLVIAAPLFGVGALTRLPVGEFRAVPETRMLITRLKEEVVSLAAAQHVMLDPNVVEDTLAGLDGLPYQWKSSMQRDIEAGHRSELDDTLGAICRKGRDLGIPTPVADMIYGTLLPVDLQARGQA